MNFIDRGKILQDERINRLKKIALIDRENIEMQPIWYEKQQKMFPTAIQISPIPSLGEVITEEAQRNAGNEDVLLQRAEGKLAQIAPRPIVQYILDRLENKDLYYLVNQWNGIEKRLREEYSTKGLDKDILISLIKDGSGKMLQPIDPTTSISSRGTARQQQEEEKLKQIQDLAKDRELELQKQRADADQLADTNQAEREKQEEERKKQEEEQRKRRESMELIARNITITRKKKKVVPAPAPPVVPQLSARWDSVTDTPFQFDESTNKLLPQYEKMFDDQVEKTNDQLVAMKPEETKAMYDLFESRFPTKMSSISSLQSEKNRLSEFIERVIFDEMYKKQEDDKQQRIQSNLSLFNTVTGMTTPPPTKVSYDDRMNELLKTPKKDLSDFSLQQTGKALPMGWNKGKMIDAILAEEYGMEHAKRKQFGFGLKREIVGKGFESPVEVRQRKNATAKKIINGKYIDLNKLKSNIITIRYCSTNALIPTVKVQTISKGVKEIVEDIMNEKFDKRLFEKLDVNEKRLIKRIVTALNVDIDLHDNSDEEFMKQFQVVLGQFRAGNNNVAIKRKLREYIAEATEAGVLPRRESQKLIFELANSD
jgi:hypothetical protein